MKRSIVVILILLTLIGSIGIQPVHAAGTVLYVKPVATGSGNCSSWANACHLQTALANAISGDQIWVMAGTHKPDFVLNRSTAFSTTKNGIAVYGGFAGTETQLNQRNFAANVTILSGDLNGDDSGFTNNGDNFYHVLVFNPGINNTVVWDGFTISGGNADGTGGVGTNRGGGIYITSSSPTLINLIITGNSSADSGGGIYAENGSSPSLTNITFSGNTAAYGGGMYNLVNSSPTLTSVFFSGNTAVNAGGGMANVSGSNPVLNSVTFSGNQVTALSTATAGGGMVNDSSSPILNHVTFTSNAAIVGMGGGMYNANSSPSLNDVEFADNWGFLGGGMHNTTGSNPSLTRVTFSSNSSQITTLFGYGKAGGIYNNSSSPILANVTFANNKAYEGGGGIYNINNSDPTIKNTTFSGNTTVSSNGGGLYNVDATSTPLLINTLIANNTTGAAPGTPNDCSGAVNGSSTNNLIEDAAHACGLVNGASGNITGSDPNLGALTSSGGDTQTLALLTGSPAIDAGIACAGCPATDQRGLPRPQGSKYDIGAYELLTINATRYAAPGGLVTGLCDSWFSACELKYALGIALSGDQVWVQAGTYTPSTANRSVSFALKNGVALYGGFSGIEFQLDQRDPAANPAILSGDLSGNDVGFTNNGENSYHVVKASGLNTSATLDGFTIMGGNANGGSDYNGGGIFLDTGTATLRNLIIQNNYASNGGGGMMINSSTSLVLVGQSTFSGNKAGTAGGGGLLAWSSTNVFVSDVTFAGNTTTASGGGLINYSTTLNLINATFSGNSATTSGGGLYIPSGTVTMSASIIADSVTNNIPGGDCVGALTGASAYNLIKGANACGLTNGTNGNIIGQDPKLGTLASNGGFTPTLAPDPASPVIDAAPIANCASIDQRGIARPQGSACDIGAYEAIIHTISGNAGTGNAYIDGTIDYLGGNLTTANANGDYSFKVLDGVTLAFWPDKIGYTFSPDSHFILSVTSDAVVNFTANRIPGILYTKPAASGNGDCLTWVNACTLQTALSTSVSGDEIWVTAGIHKPTTNGDRAISFVLKNNVKIYGGFAGTETLRTQRSPATNVTILSGDLNGNDSGFTNNGENTYQVVVASNTDTSAVLDGFTISGGNGFNGAGVYFINGKPTLTNLIIKGNYASNGGGGMMIESSSILALSNITFEGNYAGAAGGGGLLNWVVNNLVLTNVTFADNATSTNGGGMVNYSTSVTLQNTTFSGNSATTSGGGLYNNSGFMILANSIIANSTGGDCVGVLHSSSANNLIEDTGTNACGLVNGIDGNVTGSDPKLGVLANNGGATSTFALLVGSPAIDGGTNTNCPVTDQRGIARPQHTTCDIGAFEAVMYSISGNAGIAGAAITYTGGSTSANGSGDYTFNVPSGWSGTVTPSKTDYTFDPANKTYNNITSSQTAQNYTAMRVVGVRYAKPVSSGLNDCTSWTNACTLQTALTTAVSGDQIWVAAGTHKPTSGTDRSISFQLVNGVKVYGGFAGTETLLSQRNPSANVTILSGDLNSDDSGFTNNGENSYQVVVASNTDTSAVLDGFTISGGNGFNGAGLYFINGAPTLTNLNIKNNYASNGGGGMMIESSTNPILTNITFADNFAGAAGGGGLLNWVVTNLTMTNVTFANNSTSTSGGAMVNYSSDVTMRNATFSGNSAASGGGLQNFSGAIDMKNTLIANSTGGDCAGVLDASSSNNLIEDPSNACGLTNGVGGNITGSDPALGILANNGGYTQTMALGIGSPAINAGMASGCPAKDQRGVIRPQGGVCDIGAYEYRLDPSFSDVPTNYWAWAYIEGLYSAGVTSGCSVSPLKFCPATTVNRDQMAVFLLKAEHGSSYVPPAPTGVFQDVPVNYWAAGWIEQLAAEGITSGCSVSPKLYCPGKAVNRDQMAIFLLKARHGSSYVPPTPTGIFQDVPVNYWAAGWIEQLAAEGITSGCSVSPKLYCPGKAVNRDQMAIFLLKARHGSSYVPPTPTGIFQDVPVNYWAGAWIEQLSSEGVTSGCGVSPMRYCPTSPVSRSQMAVFLDKMFGIPITP